MITITRSLARQVRVIFRRALNITSRGLSHPVTFQTGPDGFRVRARSPDAAVEYHVPGDHPIEQIAVPYELLRDCEGRKEEPVELETRGKSQVTAQWRDRGVPQIVQYDDAEPVDLAAFPSPPENVAENPPGSLAALHDAMQTTDPEAIRYATNTVQARGPAGTLVATDGRQLLVQSGLQLPWEESLLVPRTTVFGCPELPQDAPVALGKTGDWVAARIGPWSLWLAINKDGRFPQVDHHLPRVEVAATRCQISAADADFLLQTLPRLPGDPTYNWPITLELNGSVVVRAKARDQAKPTEVLLSRSTCSGEPVRMNMNRRYLARAMTLGFREVFCYGPKAPVLCQDEHRRFVWALLDHESAIRPGRDPIRIESASAGSEPPSTRPQRKRRKSTVTEPNQDQNGQAKANGKPRRTAVRQPRQADVGGLIQQAEAVRTALREALSKTNELLKGLKRHRRQSRALQNTLASLRQLKTLGV